MKHFNAGHVWGRVAEIKEETSTKKTPYLQILIEVPNENFGNVKVYGRLWGEEKITAFKAHHQAHPEESYHFRGFFNQYEKGGVRYSNYTFYDWNAANGKEYRATFVLVGDVTKTEAVDGEGKIYLYLLREGQKGYKDMEETFEVYIGTPDDLAMMQPGMMIEIKGLLKTKEPEDFYGAPAEDNTVKPYVMFLLPKKGE